MHTEEIPTARSIAFRRQPVAPVIRTGVSMARTITRRASTTFYAASCFLPTSQRRAVWTIYAFCRSTDDLVDTALQTPERLSKLQHWESRVTAALAGDTSDAILAAFAQTVRTYEIPHQPIFELIEGVRRDVTCVRYDSFLELREYCDLVAATVGLMILPILGMLHENAQRYAIALGRAMQMTNILRDIGEDAAIGRVYLPVEDLTSFGCTEHDIFDARINDRFVALLQFQISRTRELYREAVPGIALLQPASRFTVRLAVRLYSGILDRIEANGYDVFTRRAFVPNSAKVIIAMQERLHRTGRSERDDLGIA